MTDLTKSLKELEAAIESSSKKLEAKMAVVNGGLLYHNDLYPTYQHLFNAEAQHAFSQRGATSLYSQRHIDLDPNTYKMVVDAILFFGAKVIGKHNIPRAVELLANLVNTHASQGHINGHLQQLGCIELAATFGLESRTDANAEYAVFTYPQFTPEGQESVKMMKYDLQMNEGELSKVVIKDEPAYNPGLANHIFRISYMQMKKALEPLAIIFSVLVLVPFGLALFLYTLKIAFKLFGLI